MSTFVKIVGLNLNESNVEEILSMWSSAKDVGEWQTKLFRYLQSIIEERALLKAVEDQLKVTVDSATKEFIEWERHQAKQLKSREALDYLDKFSDNIKRIVIENATESDSDPETVWHGEIELKDDASIGESWEWYGDKLSEFVKRMAVLAAVSENGE